MRSRNYTKEIGVASTEQPVPAAVAIVILTIVVVVTYYFVRQVAFQPVHEISSAGAPVKVNSR